MVQLFGTTKNVEWISDEDSRKLTPKNENIFVVDDGLLFERLASAESM